MNEKKLEKREYRCTRNNPYDNPGCPGHRSSSARQGHYVFAQTPLGAAIEMFSTWPDEAFHGFTIMDKENESMMWTWTMGEGLRRVNRGEEGGILAEMFIEADRDLEDETIAKVREQLAKIDAKRPRYRGDGPNWRLADDEKITVSLHHHRHGVDTYLHKSKGRGLSLAEVVEMIGDNYEEDREDEYVEILYVTTKDKIKEVEL
jgi:hypothetical protein